MSVITATYNPGVFDVVSMTEARNIILTPEEGLSTDRRWEVETPYLGELLIGELELTSKSLVLDYGCGVGRLAKELIDQVGCSVVGVDISQNMRVFAQRYVASDKFTAVSPAMLDTLVVERGLLFDAGFAVWVLQHCHRVRGDVQRIKEAMRTGGSFLTVNEDHRCVPVVEGWCDDSVNVAELMGRTFTAKESGCLSPEAVSERLYDTTHWRSYGT